jgi:hypothetical protein
MFPNSKLQQNLQHTLIQTSTKKNVKTLFKLQQNSFLSKLARHIELVPHKIGQK